MLFPLFTTSKPCERTRYLASFLRQLCIDSLYEIKDNRTKGFRAGLFLKPTNPNSRQIYLIIYSSTRPVIFFKVEGILILHPAWKLRASNLKTMRIIFPVYNRPKIWVYSCPPSVWWWSLKGFLIFVFQSKWNPLRAKFRRYRMEPWEWSVFASWWLVY